MSPKNDTDTVFQLKKTKKDGSIPEEIVAKVASLLIEKKTIIMPIDNIYGLLSMEENAVKSNLPDQEQQITRLISNFKMLDDLANINKLQFDFLHRIWPGEVVALLENKSNNGPVPLRIPKSKYVQDIIAKVDAPLYYAELYKQPNKLLYKKKEIIALFEKKIDFIFIIDEFCKDHTPPTLIDIIHGELDILYEGRVSSEEIKSLYFLGRDDSVI